MAEEHPQREAGGTSERESCATCGATTAANSQFCTSCGAAVADPGQSASRRRYYIDVVAALLLAAASVATALSLYQATRWNGAMLFDFNESARAGAQARSEESRLAADRAADVAAWNAFLENDKAEVAALDAQFDEEGEFSTTDGFTGRDFEGELELFTDQLLESYKVWVEDMARAAEASGFWDTDYGAEQWKFTFSDFVNMAYTQSPEQQVDALAALQGISAEEAAEVLAPLQELQDYYSWVAGLGSLVPASPLEHETYTRSPARIAAEEAAQKADGLFASAREANLTGDRYVLATVLFSLTLFFAGISTKFTAINLQTAMVVCSGCFLLTGTALFVTLPFH